MIYLLEDEKKLPPLSVGSGTSVNIEPESKAPSQRVPHIRSHQLGVDHLITDTRTRYVFEFQSSQPFVVMSLTDSDVRRKRVQRESSPFVQLLNYEDKLLQDEINRLHNNMQTDYVDTIAQRIEYLIHLGYEEEPGRAPLAAGSLSNFINFLLTHPELQRPNIVLTPSRNIQAQWGKKRDQKLVVEFLHTYEIGFVLFTRDIDRPSKISRLSGKIFSRKLLPTIAPYGVLSWVCRN